MRVLNQISKSVKLDRTLMRLRNKLALSISISPFTVRCGGAAASVQRWHRASKALRVFPRTLRS